MTAPEAPLNPVKLKPCRPIWERVLVWGGIAVLLAVVLLEWTSRNNFQASLERLEEAAPGRGGQRLLEAEVSRHVRGLAFRGEERIKNSRVITYRWPSVFKTYQLRLPLDSTGAVTMVETVVSEADTTALPIQPSPRTSNPNHRLPLPKQGLPAGSEDTVALFTHDATIRFGAFGSLARELFRQSVLIAARDEMGLPTRDESLGEIVPETDSAVTFPFELQIMDEVATTKPGVFTVNAELSRPNTNGKRFEWVAPPISLPIFLGLEPLAERVEAFSRKELVEALHLAGCQKSGSAPDATGSELEIANHSLDVVSQYAAVRGLHEAIRRHGETADRLSGLVRAYGNLGQLTEYLWCPASKVFKARSFLYALRLGARFGKTKSSEAHRAYALAMTGLHASALAAVNSARNADGPSVPDWLPVIEAFCQHNPKILDEASGSLVELAAYLKMRMTDPEGEPEAARVAVQRLLTANPACFQGLDTLWMTRGLGVKRLVTEQAYELMWPVVYSRLTSIPSLPPVVKEVAINQVSGKPPLQERTNPEHQARLQVFSDLNEAGRIGQDRAEPSWTVLAALLKESTFVEVHRTLDVLETTLAVPVDETRAELLPLVRGHWFEKYIESYSDDQSKAAAELATQFSGLAAWPLELTTSPMVDSVYYRLSREQYSQIAMYLVRHSDETYDDLVRNRRRSPDVGQTASILRAVSPHRPLSIAMSIQQDPDLSVDESQRWEQSHSDSPIIIQALAAKHRERGRIADTERCLKRLVELSTGPQAHLQLAEHYRQQENWDACQTTLEKALELPSLGLEDIQVRVQLAGLLMRNGNWQEAWPYAEEAAQSYAEWALEAAARCAEGMEDWETAESYRRASAERYVNSSPDWYLWCVRTNRGDIDEARNHARRYWESLTPPFTPQQVINRGLDHLINEDWAAAQKSFLESYEKHQNLFSAVRVIVLADKLGELKQRDALFQQLEADDRDKDLVGELTNLLRTAMKEGESGRWNRNEFELLAVLTREEIVGAYYCLAGEFLAQHGRQDLAVEYLQIAATMFHTDGPACLQANLSLRRLGIQPGKQRLNVLPDEIAEPARLLRQADRHRALQNFDEAERLIEEAVSLRPNFLPAIMVRASLNQARGQYPEALAGYRDALKLDPDFIWAHNDLAWLLATCDQDNVRDSESALRHARRANELRAFPSYTTHSTLAAAHAECGQFDKAVEFQKLAVNQRPPKSKAMDVLKQYQAGKPFRHVSDQKTFGQP